MNYVASVCNSIISFRKFGIGCWLVLTILSPSHAQSGPVTHYRMDNVFPGAGSGTFFTFSVDDLNEDGIGSSNEIFNFSGIECAICPAEITLLGSVGTDILFGGSGEAFLDLSTLNWTYEITGSTKNPVTLEVDLTPRDLLKSADFSFGFADGTGIPQRLFAVSEPGMPRIWEVNRVEDATPNTNPVNIQFSAALPSYSPGQSLQLTLDEAFTQRSIVDLWVLVQLPNNELFFLNSVSSQLALPFKTDIPANEITQSVLNIVIPEGAAGSYNFLALYAAPGTTAEELAAGLNFRSNLLSQTVTLL